MAANAQAPASSRKKADSDTSGNSFATHANKLIGEVYSKPSVTTKGRVPVLSVPEQDRRTTASLDEKAKQSAEDDERSAAEEAAAAEKFRQDELGLSGPTGEDYLTPAERQRRDNNAIADQEPTMMEDTRQRDQQKAETAKEYSDGQAYMQATQPATTGKSSSAAISDERMAAIFKKATASTYNPNSKGDRQSMAQLKALLQNNPDLAGKSDTKVALAWYKTLA
jgi:hypothetical protein